MTPPPCLIGAALLFWGWQSGIVLPALAMAVLLESARWVDWRLDLKRADFDRVWDLCAALFLAASLYCFMSRGGANSLMKFLQSDGRFIKAAVDDALVGVFTFFQWWPILFFPFAVAQAFASKPVVPLSTFSWYMRRRRGEAEAGLERDVPVGPAYCAVCLFAASLSNSRPVWFFPGFALLLTWALWASRPQRFRFVVWFALLVLVLKGGWWHGVALHKGQSYLENKISGWASSFIRRDGRRRDSQTSIGQIGHLKLSGAIVMRAEPAVGSPVPGLLRDSSFHVFNGRAWIANKSDFTEVVPESDALTWKLLPEQPAPHSLQLWTSVPGGRGFIAVPSGTMELGELAAGAVETNRMGVIRVSDAPGLLQCRARWNITTTRDSWPSMVDVEVPIKERPAVDQVLAGLNLEGKTDDQKVAAIAAHFTDKFRYSTWLSINAIGIPTNLTPVGNFLTRSRVGHCEYFATAATLLLRRAGVHARYANGYALGERERGTSRRYIVRERHAHAWVIVWSWRDMAWKDFDPTPGGWVETEAESAPFWEPLSDWWSRMKFAFATWRAQTIRGVLDQALVPLLLLLIAVLAWRILRRRQGHRRRKQAGAADAPLNWPGLDSEFYLVEQRLERLGIARLPGETFASWFGRLERSAVARTDALRPALELHNRLRFDPRGLDAAGRDALRDGVRRWLAESAG
jgi:hypothetical protein